MNTVALSWRYLTARPLAAALNVLLLALALASITVVLLTRAQVDRAFERDLAGIDVVVGAKGSPLQLILSGVFHLDVPPGNVSLADMRALQTHPQVAELIPLSLGDSWRGHRIVGTTSAYVLHYGATVAQGALWTEPLQAVLGAQVAQAKDGVPALKVGDQFVGSHGLGGGGHQHGNQPYTVSGVLAPCGCVLDRLVLTSLESVWAVHEGDMAQDDEDRAALAAEREVTMALIRYKSPLAAVSFPRFVNTTTPMQAAAPALEITRLLRLVGVGSEVLRGFGLVLLAVAALSTFIALWHAVRERRTDLAMLRMLGAPPRRMAALLLAEATWLAVLATALGLALGHGLTSLLGWWLPADQAMGLTGALWVAEELWVPALALGVAVLAALLPAWQAYRLDVAELLNPA